jgi:SecD/SecF fusion protein
MAVDANVILFERAKEGLRAGKTLDVAVDEAYTFKGGLSSIFDANITTMLTAIILFIFGTGPIKGFATTLLIGIFTSLFTSIFIARIFIDRDIAKNRTLNFSTAITKNWFTGFHFDFIKVKKWTYLFSSIVVVVSCVSFFVNGLDEGVDFVGGRTYQIKFEKPVESNVVSEELSKEFGLPVEAKVFGDADQLKITTKYKIKEEGIAIDKEVNEKLYNGLKKYFNEDLTYDKFINLYEGKKFGVLYGSKVSPTISADIKTNSFWAVIGAMLVVALYLVISFRKYGYSIGAVAAVAHDVIFVLGIYSLCYKFMPFHMEMDQHFIAAILTVIGYSMNDTVIVFDRIREYSAKMRGASKTEIINKSINDTLSRTIMTSLTVFLTILILFIFGGEVTRGFAFAMLVGVISGTYSTIFVASPVLIDIAKSKPLGSADKAKK